MSDKTKDTLRRKMALYEEMPPQGLQDDVMAEMERRRRRKLIPIAAATLLGAAAAIALLMMNVDTIREAGNMEMMSEVESKEEVVKEEILRNIVSQKPFVESHKAKAIKSEPILLAEARIEATNDLPSEDISSEDISSEDIPVEDGPAPSEPKEVEKETVHQDQWSTIAEDDLSMNTSHKEQRGVSIGVSINGNAINSNSLSLGSSDKKFPPMSSSNYGYTYYNHGEIEPIETASNIDHHQPVKVGLSVAIPIAEKWSLETGLFYSHHSSDIEFPIRNYHLTQHLNYVGVPLNVLYQIWHNRRWNVYGSAGPALEKMVSGKQTDSSGSHDVSIKALQWSINAHGGVEYRLNTTMGIYLEPGLGYYFDNHSAIPTFYSAHPWNLDFKLGLRIFTTKR